MMIIARFVETQKDSKGKEITIDKGYKLATFSEDLRTGFTIGCVQSLGVNETIRIIREYSAIMNATVKDGKVVGTNGSLDRYPTISDRGTSKEIVIISKLQDGFKCCNGDGYTISLTTEEVVDICKAYGISNGKIVTVNGTETISCISGSYINERNRSVKN